MVFSELKRIRVPVDLGAAFTRAPLVANLFMVVAVSYAAAQLTWMLWPQPTLPDPPVVELKGADASASRPQTVVTPNIAALHLFGEIVVEQPKFVEAPPSVEQAQETQLRLTLNGVFILDKPRSWAIIADAMGNEDTYKTNAPIPGGAILKEIHKDKVILLYNGRFETLSLPRDELGGEGEGGTNVARAGGFAPQQDFSGRPPGGGFDGGQRGFPGVQSLSPEASASLRNYRDALVRDPQSVMDVVRAEPFRRGGQLIGYRVFPGRDRQLMMQVGLQPGDVVTGINGVSLDSPLKGLEVMKDLSSAQQVSLSVMRNGITQTLSVPLN